METSKNAQQLPEIKENSKKRLSSDLELVRFHSELRKTGSVLMENMEK